MRRIVVGMVITACFFLPHLEARAQSTVTTSDQPVQWEYLTVIEQFGRMALMDVKTAATWESLGNQGWELVAYHPDNVGGPLLTFKRPQSVNLLVGNRVHLA